MQVPKRTTKEAQAHRFTSEISLRECRFAWRPFLAVYTVLFRYVYPAHSVPVEHLTQSANRRQNDAGKPHEGRRYTIAGLVRDRRKASDDSETRYEPLAVMRTSVFNSNRTFLFGLGWMNWRGM